MRVTCAQDCRSRPFWAHMRGVGIVGQMFGCVKGDALQTIDIIRKACRSPAVNPGSSAVVRQANGSTFLPDCGRNRHFGVIS
jgi:hypothetical protein